MTIVRTTLLASLAAGGIVAAGCGGGDDKALSKAELAKKADAICVKYNKQQRVLANPTKQSEVVGFLAKLQPIAEAQGKELHALKPADDVKATWTPLLADYDTTLDKFKDAITALKAGKKAEYERITTELDALNTKDNKVLDRLGAPHCGSQSGT